MTRPANYNTKQREAILQYIISLNGGHITAAQIVEHFGKENAAVGRTTIYRHLDKLVESGEVRRYNLNGVSGACFQYVDQNPDCHEHFHLKCEGCGELIHLECGVLSDMQRHISSEHDFQVDMMKSVLYGKCNSCRGS